MAIRALLLGAAAALVAAATPASAVNLVTNGSFESTIATDKTYFNGQVAGWSGGLNLTFIDFPGTADDPSKYLAVYGPFPATSPDGGNFVEGDGDPGYSGAIYQTINDLTIGKQYLLTFYQAAGQQLGFTGPTTEQWQVTFGTDTRLSSLFSLPEAGVGPWQAQSMTFTATAVSQVLTFLAKGTPGGKPPISFLDGVSLSAVPEPASWGMMIVGFGAVGGAMRRRKQIVATA
jgi:hypothetical protein